MHFKFAIFQRYLLRAFFFSAVLYLTTFFPRVICKEVENILKFVPRTSVCELTTQREIFAKANSGENVKNRKEFSL